MEDEEIHKHRNWIATIISIAALLFIGFFAWRVVYFTGLINSGEFQLSDYSFTDRFTSNIKLASAPIEGSLRNISSSKAPSLGNKNAPVQIVEFADFGCPYSREVSFSLRELAQKYPQKIYYQYREFPIVEIHPIAQKASEAGRCAKDQGRFWEYHDKLYQNQSQLDEDSLFEFAQTINLNMAVFRGCMESGRHEKTVLKDYEDGFEAGVRGTPTFFINGNMIPGAIPKDVLETIINSVDVSNL